MELSVSNIGWDISDDKKVLSLLKKYKIKNIDIAPTKYFKNPSKTTFKDISKVKRWWNNEGIKIFGMQSLMFGTKFHMRIGYFALCACIVVNNVS